MLEDYGLFCLGSMSLLLLLIKISDTCSSWHFPSKPLKKKSIYLAELHAYTSTQKLVEEVMTLWHPQTLVPYS